MGLCSVPSDSVQPHGLQPARLLCPWDSPGKNTGVDCHALLQGIFLTQGLNPHLLHLLHYRQSLYSLNDYKICPQRVSSLKRQARLLGSQSPQILSWLLFTTFWLSCALENMFLYFVQFFWLFVQIICFVIIEFLQSYFLKPIKDICALVNRNFLNIKEEII